MDFTRQFCLASKLQKQINRKITQAELKANAFMNPKENQAKFYYCLIEWSGQLPVFKPIKFIYMVANSKIWLIVIISYETKQFFSLKTCSI